MENNDNMVRMFKGIAGIKFKQGGLDTPDIRSVLSKFHGSSVTHSDIYCRLLLQMEAHFGTNISYLMREIMPNLERDKCHIPNLERKNPPKNWKKYKAMYFYRGDQFVDILHQSHAPHDNIPIDLSCPEPTIRYADVLSFNHITENFRTHKGFGSLDSLEVRESARSNDTILCVESVRDEIKEMSVRKDNVMELQMKAQVYLGDLTLQLSSVRASIEKERNLIRDMEEERAMALNTLMVEASLERKLQNRMKELSAETSILRKKNATEENRKIEALELEEQNKGKFKEKRVSIGDECNLCEMEDTLSPVVCKCICGNGLCMTCLRDKRGRTCPFCRADQRSIVTPKDLIMYI